MRTVKVKKSLLSAIPPTVLIVGSFFVLILIGALLLMLPISTKLRIVTAFRDCLFTATSATCVTGLIVRDTYNYWSVFGQAVILFLIQIGGMGLVTITLFVGSFIKRKFGLKELTLAQESVNYNSLPEVWTILRMVVSFSLIIEAIGAVALMPSFVGKYGSGGVFKAIFISISAYCNAGFDLMGAEGDYINLCGFSEDPAVLLIVSALIVIGGLGALVWYDLVGSFKTKTIMLHSKVVFGLTAALIVGGGVLFFLSEYYNPATLSEMTFGNKALNSLFQSVTARTAGFSSVSMSGMFDRTKILMILLMFIGAAPGSTGGGIKITTFWVVVMTIWSFLRGRRDTVIRGNRVRPEIVYRSLTVMILMLLLAFGSSVAIYSIESQVREISVLNVLFEVFSAVDTVGLSADLTPTLMPISRLILTADMFLGRVGLVTFALAITTHRETKHKNEVLPEGTIMVG